MEKEEWINRRTADPNKIGKLWWNKMYNQCHLPMEKRTEVPRDIEDKMMREFLKRQQQTPEDVAKWMNEAGTRGIIRAIFSDVDGETVNISPEQIKKTLDMSYRLYIIKGQQKTTDISNIQSNLCER